MAANDLRVGRLVVLTLAYMLFLAAPWAVVADALAYPAVWLAGWVLEWSFFWVRTSSLSDGVAILETGLLVFVPVDGTIRAGDLVSEVRVRTYGYSTLLFWALSFASVWAAPSPMWLLRIALGTAVLWLPQAWGVAFQWLRDTLILSGQQVFGQTGLPPIALEVAAYGYQLGFLILAPLSGVVVWLALNPIARHRVFSPRPATECNATE